MDLKWRHWRLKQGRQLLEESGNKSKHLPTHFGADDKNQEGPVPAGNISLKKLKYMAKQLGEAHRELASAPLTTLIKIFPFYKELI